jgi:chemotaxis methyl-accepting protein methylase
MMEFSPAEKEQIFSLAENITGNCQKGSYRREVIISNVLRRVTAKKANHLQDYLKEAISDDIEFAYLVSALTIHTTEWFREVPHFTRFEEILKEKFKHAKHLKLLSAACSTGEEVYSFAMLLESYKKLNLKFDYEISAFDIDPVSVEIAKKGHYNLKELTKIQASYHTFIKMLTDEDGFTFNHSIQHRCKFYTDNLIKLQNTKSHFDTIVCRNVLIYFTPEMVKKILECLIDKLNKGGILIIGHSDILNPKDFNLKSHGNSIFEKI